MYLRFQERKTKNLKNLKISANSVDSPCTTNLRNRRKVAFLTYMKKKSK